MTTGTLPRLKLGPITPELMYPLVALQVRSGMGKTAMRSARRKGLKVRYVCGRAFVKGADFITFVEEFGHAAKRQSSDQVQKVRSA